MIYTYKYKLVITSMELAIDIVQICFSVLLILAVLLQHSNAGLGATFGGSGSIQTAKRGIDKVLFNATIALAILFFATALLQFVV